MPREGIPRDDAWSLFFGTGPRVTPHLGPNTPLLSFGVEVFDIWDRVADYASDVGIIHGGEAERLVVDDELYRRWRNL